MISARFFPKTEEELSRIVETHAGGIGHVVMQTGHFLLFYDNTEALILPGVADLLLGPRQQLIAQEIGRYPLLTWEIGIPILAGLRAERRQAIVVVNDWQYVPEGVDRSGFYLSHPELPVSYQRVLAAHPDVELLCPPRKPNLNTGRFFSEQSLRNAYERHIKHLIRNNALPAHARVESGREIRCSLEDSLGQKREIYCSGKRQNCTHEVAELVWTIHDLTHANVFVNFFPLVCKEYMIEGTELSYELFRHGVRQVINVGMQSSHIQSAEDVFRGAEVIVHEFRD